MAANMKFKEKEIVNQLRHVTREIKYPKNIDIDKSRTHLNYSLTPNRDMTPFEYLKHRLSKVHINQRRDDTNLMSGWIITKPKDLYESQEEDFFKACYEFLKSRYGGEENVISVEIHKDESGEPHMHFCFTPITEYIENENLVKVVKYLKKNPDKNNTQAGKELGIDRKTVRRYRNCNEDDIKTERLSAKAVINKEDLKTFHPDLQKYLSNKGIECTVNSGITKKQGGNITVAELKMQRDYLKEHGTNIDEILEHIDRATEVLEKKSYDEELGMNTDNIEF